MGMATQLRLNEKSIDADSDPNLEKTAMRVFNKFQK